MMLEWNEVTGPRDVPGVSAETAANGQKVRERFLALKKKRFVFA